MSGSRAVFLDRDGTMIVEKDYLSNPDQVELLPGASVAMQRLIAARWRLVVVTNQSGIGRGFFGEQEYAAVAARLEEVLAEEGIELDGVYHCPDAPGGPSDCRKPAIGMHARAGLELGLDLAACVYVGDKTSDVEPASVLGGTGILVRTGHGREHEARVGPDVTVVDDLPAAVDFILAPPG